MVMGAVELLDPPRGLGHMTLLARLGEGGMATVYLASIGEGSLARSAAVKLLRAELPDHDYRARFYDEANVLVRLRHNNLVDVRDAGEIEGQLYISMELIEGRDLADVWDRCAELGKAIPVALSVHIVREVLRGLHYAHTFPDLELVHRDVSPSNVLVDWHGAVRLADFGLATSTLKMSLTTPGVVFGKVGYMSPEQARREPLDARADVYACGAVLWELLTGRPLRGDGRVDTASVARFEAVPPSALSRRVDPDLDAIVVRALARNQNARYGSARELLDALNGWMARHAPEITQDRLAEFILALFGSERERERKLHETLLRSAGESTRTQVFMRSPVELEHSSDAFTTERTLEAERELLFAGSIITDRYRILSLLGHGGMGTVYVAEHVTVGRSVAVKVLTHEWSQDEVVASRFRTEARVASAVGHMNIVEVFDAGTLQDGRLFIVMELLTGRTLHEEIQLSGPLPLLRACKIVREVARAIRAAHQAGIIHRDLKPDNVMLVERDDGEGELVKVLDFGISALADVRSAGRLTSPGHAVGTPEYMAPEQALGHLATQAFDIYALGVMLYEAVTGEPPISSQNILEVLSRKAVERAPSLTAHRGGAPRELIELVSTCLEIDPAGRPSSAQTFLDRLDTVLDVLAREQQAPNPAPQRRAVELSEPEDARDTIIPANEAPITLHVERTASAWGRVALLAGVAGTFVVAFTVWPRASSLDDGANSELVSSTGVALAGTKPPTVAIHDAAEVVSNAQDRASNAGYRTLVPTDVSSSAATTESVRAQQPRSSSKKSGGVEQKRIAVESQCARIKSQAAEARRDGIWSTLLSYMNSKQCWTASEHVRLRTLALKELGRFSECAEVGQGHRDKDVQSWVELCKRRASGH